ncbi:MAG: two-component regulator propeller domain-containing protein [Ferruginibacter sp.]
MRKAASFLWLFFMFIKLPAQNSIGLPKVQNYSRDDYKGGRQVWCIAQDSSGRIYSGNNEGLLVYDGCRWERYSLPNRTCIRAIFPTNGRIYVGGENEIGYFSPNEQGRLNYHTIKNPFETAFSNFAAVWKIEYFNGSLFFMCRNVIFEYRDNVVKTYTSSKGRWQMLKLSGERLFAQDTNLGLCEFNGRSWVQVAPNLKKGFLISGMAVAGTDSFLISSEQDGLYLFHQKKMARIFSPSDPIFLKHYITSLNIVNDSVYAAGTVSAGCFFINKKGEISQQISREEGLRDNSVLTIQPDREGNVWVGLNNGISCIAFNSAFKYIKPSKENDFAGHDCLLYNNRLYAATSDGVFFSDPLTNKTNISLSKGNFSFLPNTKGQCWKLNEINSKLLLSHTKGGFLIKNNMVVKLPYETGTWFFTPANIPGRIGSEVIAGTYTGILKLTPDAHRVLSAFPGLTISLRFVALANDGSIWASHPSLGIYRFYKEHKEDSVYKYAFYNKNGLPSPTGNYVFPLAGKIIFTTEKGIYEFDGLKKTFIRSREWHSLLGENAIQYLKEDREGNIWFCMGERTGILLNERKGWREIVYFPELSGNILYGFENIYPYNNENIFIAADRGIIHLNLSAYRQPGSTLPTLLSAVTVPGDLNDSTVWSGYNLDSIHNKNPEIRLSSNNNSLHFYFSSPSYNPWRKTEFSYYLEGYDDGWSSPGFRTEKEYTNLPHGKYVFHVKAVGTRGQVASPAVFQFTISAPVYKTTTAYIIYFFLSVTAIWFIYSRIKNKIALQKQKFEEEQKRLKYIHQLEIEKNEREIIKLQNEKLANEIIYKNKELASVSMHLVERTDALLKVKGELERLSKKNDKDHDIKKVTSLLKEIEKNDANWQLFATHFDELNNNFLKKLSTAHPGLTHTDLKICAYLQLNMSSKEIAQLMNLSLRGIETSRYRLRKKINLKNDQKLYEYLRNLNEEIVSPEPG